MPEVFYKGMNSNYLNVRETLEANKEPRANTLRENNLTYCVLLATYSLLAKFFLLLMHAYGYHYCVPTDVHVHVCKFLRFRILR